MIVPKSMFVSIPIFIINPLLGVLSQFCFLLLNKENSKGARSILYLLLSVFLGLVNSTKTPVTDLYTYYELFNQVPEFQFYEYLLIMGKEPFFSFINFIGYYLLAGNFKLYLTILTVVSYMLIYLSIDKYFTYQSKERKLLLFSVFFISVFSEFFTLSAHLVRQFLAASMFIYFLINYIYYNKNQWWLLIISILTHSTVIFFVLLLFIPSLRQKINVKNFLLIVLLGFIFSIGLFTLSKFLYELTAGIPFLGYIFSRTTEAITRDDGGIGFAPLLLILIMCGVSVYQIYVSKNNDPKDEFFYNIYLLLLCFILLTISQPLLSLRFLFFAYFFVPFIFVRLFLFKKRLSPLIQSFVFILMLIRFFIDIETGIWEYGDIEGIIGSSIFNYY